MNWGWISHLTLFTLCNSWLGNRWANPPGEIHGTSNAWMSTTLVHVHDLTTRHSITPRGTSQRYRLSCRFHPLKLPLWYPGHGVHQILDRWDQSNVYGQSILFYQRLYRFQSSAEQHFAGGLHAYSGLSGERVHQPVIHAYRVCF